MDRREKRIRLSKDNLALIRSFNYEFLGMIQGYIFTHLSSIRVSGHTMSAESCPKRPKPNILRQGFRQNFWDSCLIIFIEVWIC